MPSVLALDELADLLGVLGHADRLKLLLELRRTGPADVATLVERIGASQSRTSQHLGLLRAHHLVESTRDGRRVIYAIRDEALADWLIAGLAFLERGTQLDTSIQATTQRYTLAPE